MKKNLLILFFLCSTLSGCKKNASDEVTPKEKVNMQGKITLSGDINPSTIKIIAGFTEGKIISSKKNSRVSATSTELSCDIPVTKDKVQLISAVNEKGEFLSMCIVKGDESSFEMNTNSSAQALLFLNPFYATKDPNLAKKVLTKIRDGNTCKELTVNLENKIQKALVGAGSTLDLTQMIGSDLGFYLENLEKELNWTLDLKPFIDDVNGIKFINPKISTDGKKISFSVENNRKRWLQIAIDKYKKVGDTNPDTKASETFSLSTFADTKSWNYLIPSPGDYELKTKVLDPDTYNSFLGIGDFWQRYANNERLKSTSNLIESDVSNFEKVEVKIYGIGFNGIPQFRNEDLDRLITPAALSFSFDLIIPIIDIIFDTNTVFKNISQKPYTMLFIQKVAESLLANLDFKAIFQQRSIYITDAKEKLKIAVGASFNVITSNKFAYEDLAKMFIENNLDYKLLGTNVITKKMLESVVPYFKMVQIGLKAYNIGDFVYTILTGSSINTYPFYTGKTDLDNGLVLYLPLEEKIEDITGQFTVNTIGNSLKQIDGAKGKAYDFNNQYGFIRLEPKVSIDFSKGHTFSHWVKLTDFELYKNLSQVAFSLQTGSSWIISNYGVLPPDFISRENQTNSIGQKCQNNYESVNSKDGQWHHVVWTAGDTWERGYIDGILSYSFSCEYLSFPKIYDLYIGRFGKTGSYQFKGGIDEFKIYNRSLNDAEIMKLFQEGAPTKSGRIAVSTVDQSNTISNNGHFRTK